MRTLFEMFHKFEVLRKYDKQNVDRKCIVILPIAQLGERQTKVLKVAGSQPTWQA